MFRIASIISVLLIGIISSAVARKFNRAECYASTLQMIQNGSLALTDEVFFRDDSGQPMIHPDNITLTRGGCEKLCGSQAFYWDIGPRLSTWLIPILLLVSNVELSPIDKKRFLAIVHLFGDPIDSIWSLVHKMDAWSLCYSLAESYGFRCERRKRVVATVFAGFEEVDGIEIDSKHYFDVLINSSKPCRESSYREWRQTARELADSRTDEFLRACLAVSLYVYQVIAAFVKEVGGGNTSPPGGRIGTALFISWLVPVVLLSNAIGGFTSRRSCFDILHRFAERTNIPFVIKPRNSHFKLFGLRIEHSPAEYPDSLSWSGAIYTYRPWKTLYMTGEQGRYRKGLLLLLSISPIYKRHDWSVHNHMVYSPQRIQLPAYLA